MGKFSNFILRTTLFICILVFSLWLGLASSSKVDAADSYATEWQMSDGTSFQVISGNLADNSNGAPYTIESGEQSAFFVMYSISPSDPNGPDKIEKGKFAIRITIPGDFEGSVSRMANSNWSLVEGTATDPNAVPADGASNRYYWMISEADLSISAGDTLTFFVTPFENGITPDGTTFPFKAAVFNLSNNKNISGDSASSFVANTEKLNWNNATLAVTGGGQSASRTELEAPSVATLATPLAFTVKATPNPATPNYSSDSAVFGTSYAKSFTFRNTYQLPMDSIDETCPLIKIDESMFTDSSGNALDPGVVKLIKNAQGKVTGFSIEKTISNSNTAAQLAAPTFAFKITGAQIDGTCASLAAMEGGSNKTFSITQVASNHEVEPAVKLDAETVLNANGKKDVGQAAMPAMNFTYRVIAQEDPVASYKDTEKKIVSIAGKSTNDMVAPYSAYPGDTVVYEVGAEQIQNKNTTAVNLQYTEVAGVDYDPAKIIPTKIYTANISGVHGKWNVVVEYSDGTATINRTNLNNGTTIDIANGANVSKITITNTLATGLTINRGHYISYQVVDQNDLSKDGVIVKNNANLTYTNGDTEKKSKSEVDFTYKLKPFNQAGLYESDKSGINLGGTTEKSTPKPGDVIEFILNLDSHQGASLRVDQILDHYTSDYLELYNGTTTTVDGTTQIDSKLLNNSNALNLKLWSTDPRTGSSSPISFPGGEPTIVVNNGIINIKFKQDIVIPEGHTYYLTYTMAVKEGYTRQTTIGNEFNSYLDGMKNGEGLFYWGPIGKDLETDVIKYHSNASVPTDVKSPWNSAPYGGDVILYTLKVTNGSQEDWVDDVVITDTFDDELLRYDADAGINSNYTKLLNLNNPYNLAALKPGESISVKGLQGAATIATNATNFNPELVTITDPNPNDKTFSINIGAGNTIKVGETVVFVYTLQVAQNVSPTDDMEYDTKENEIINECLLTYNNLAKGICSDTWHINANENIQGMVDLTKAATAVSNNHSTTRVENGDVVTYTVSMSNDHIKANRHISFEAIMDKLPSNMTYVDGSFKINYYKVEYDTSGNVDDNPSDYTDGTETKIPLDLSADAKNYTLTYVDTNDDGKNDTLKVVWNKPLQLTAGNYVGTEFQKVETFMYEFEYDLVADTSNIAEANTTLPQINTVKVFTNNNDSELLYKNGTITDDTTADEDGRESTKASIEQTSEIKLINDNFFYGSVVKTVTSGNTAFNIDGATEGRSYKIVIKNTGAADYTISRFVDILPYYENYKEGTLKIGTDNIDENKLSFDKFVKPDLEDRERLIYNGDIVIPANSSIELTYSTIVDKEAANAEMIETQTNSITGTGNAFGFYTKNNVNLNLKDGGSSSTDDDPLDPSGNWDNDVNTTRRYYASVNVTYTDNSLAPGVDISTQIVKDDSGTISVSDYIKNLTPINPGEDIAYTIKIGNGTNATTSILPGSQIVLVLPSGVAFDVDNPDRQYIRSTPANTTNTDTSTVYNKNKPSWLSDPIVKTSEDGQQTLIWTVNATYNKGSYAAFTVLATTEQYRFTSYSPEVYFVPLQQSNQDFYGNVVTASANNLYTTAWKGYQHLFSDISEYIDDLKGKSHYVKDSISTDVYGTYGISSYKTVSNAENTITKPTVEQPEDRLLNLESRTNIFRYTLGVEGYKKDAVGSKVVLIDRLPTIGDITANKPTAKRNSEAAVRLQGDGNFEVKYKESADSAIVALDEGQYLVEYFFGGCDDVFTEQDTDGVSQSGRWFTETSASAAGKDFNKATAIRVTITDPDVIISNMGKIEASFDAHLGEKTEDYNISDSVANNTFGYKYHFGNVANNIVVRPESVSVSVAAEVPDSKVIINKSVDLNGLTDNNSRAYFESVNNNKTFDFTLIGKDSNGTQKYEDTFSLPITENTSIGYSGTKTIEELDPSLTYTLTEANNPNFTKDIQVTSEVVSDQTIYTFEVTNTWSPVKLKAEKTWLDASGTTISAGDINTLLGNIVTGNITVDLYNSKTVLVNSATGELTPVDNPDTDDVDESALSINDLKIKSSTISLTNLTADFGVVNQYDNEGNKITYLVNESNSNINYSLFEITNSYSETTTDGILNGIFEIDNKVIGGAVELVKKDDLGNTLKEVDFKLTDPLGIETTYSTNTSGKIEITNLNPGSYSFTEVAAPTGYTAITAPLTFTITANQAETVKLEAINPIIKGSVELTKSDDLDNTLQDAEFDLFNDEGTKIGSYETNSNGQITVDNLIPDNYYFVETSAPTGYIQDSSNIEFTIAHNPTETVSVSAVNEIIKGSVELTKSDDLGNTLQDAEFDLFNDEGTKIGSYETNSSGLITVNNLIPDDYYFVETSAPTGYIQDSSNIEFTIAHNPTETVSVSAVNEIIKGSVELTKSDDLGNTLQDAEFDLFNDEGAKIGSYVTNTSGKINVADLVPDDYYFIETKAPTGYSKEANNIEFTIIHNPSEEVSVSAINPIIRGTAILTKLDESDNSLENAEFEFYNEKDEVMYNDLKSNAEGKITIENLIPGTYYFKEIAAPDGYLMMPVEGDRVYVVTIPFNPSEAVNVEAYNYPPLLIDPPIEKKVTGNNAPDSTFTFTMVGSENAPMPEGSNGNTKTVQAKAGGIEFGEITYTELGTYTYTLSEVAGNNKEFVYDTSKYTIIVDITFDGRALQKNITIENNGAKTNLDKIVFVNKYEPLISTVPNTGNSNLLMVSISLVFAFSLTIYYYRRNA
ncbi:hypothetical protein LJB88_00480 [Erysipelotrichaceae bacterium OttesenSCG-928-M19]|nr:hypothetical protein [Erysipelotrichaceae bacterium OttesenSCG-928-M19]